MTQAEPSRSWIAPFFTIWIGQAFSLFGSRLAQFALVWWLTRETGSPTVLAIATGVALLPEVLLGPLCGALVDRWPRRRVMMVADGFVALVSLWLALLFWTNAMQPWHIYVAMLARSLGGVFHFPAMQSSTTLMAPKEHLPRIAGMNQILQGMLTVMAPPLGALAMEWLPLHQVMGIDVMTALIAILPLTWIQIPQPNNTPTASGIAAVWADMLEGFRYLFRWRGLFYACLLAMWLNFTLLPPMNMMPLLIKQHFGGEALQLGWIESAWGIGLVGGGLLLMAWGGFKRRIITALLGIIGTGLGVAALGIIPPTGFPLALAAMGFAGIMNAMCNGSFMAVLQGVVPPEIQGRVFNVVGSATALMMPLSMGLTALGGPLLERTGLQPLFLVGGLAQALLGAAAFFIPPLMAIEETRHTELTAETASVITQ